MAASDWIPCRIHPTHPKVLAVAQMTGDSPAEACGKIIAWFWHVDQTYDISRTYLTINAFHNVVLSPRKRRNKASYFEAFSDDKVGWIELGDDGTVLICDYENNFGKSSKRRAQDRKRKQRQRERDARDESCIPPKPRDRKVTQSVTRSVTKNGHVTPPKNKEERINTSKQERASASPQSAPDPVRVAAAGENPAQGQGIPPDILGLYDECEIAVNRRTEALARLAAETWADAAADKLAEVAQRCQDTGKQQGVMIEEMELAANRHKRHAEAMAARRQHMRENPVVAMTPEQTVEGARTRLKRAGWRRVRRAIRELNLYRPPNITKDRVFQCMVAKQLGQQSMAKAS